MSSWTELGIIFGLDLVITILCLVGFYFMVMPYLMREDGEYAIIKARALGWTFEAAKQMSPHCSKAQQLAATLYIQFIDLLIALNAFMVLATCVLMPVYYYTGEDEEDLHAPSDDKLERFTMVHMNHNAMELWGTAVYTWLISFLTLYLVISSRHRFRAQEDVFDFGLAKKSLQMRNLPRDLVDSMAIKEQIQQQHPEVLSVHVAYELSALTKLMKRQYAVEDALAVCQRAKAVDFHPRIDIKHRIKRLEKRQRELSNEINDLKSRPLCSSGHVFVTFGTERAAVEALAHSELYHSLESMLEGKRATHTLDLVTDTLLDRTQPAPEPQLIDWRHLTCGSIERYSRTCCANAVLFVAIIFLFSSSTLLEVADTLTSAMPDWVANSLVSYLPTFVTFLASWVLVPLLLQIVANLSEFQTYDSYAVWYLTRYYVYIIIAIIFVTTTTMGISALIESWVSSKSTDETFRGVFDAAYTVYFIKYVMNFALLSTPFELLQAPELVLTFFESVIFRCGRSCCNRWANKYTRNMMGGLQTCCCCLIGFCVAGTGIPSIALFEYPRQYVVVLHVFAIGLIYSSSMPIISPFTMLFLIMKRKVDILQLVLQPEIPIHSQDGLFIGSSDVAVQPLNLVIVSLAIFQLGTVYYLSYKEMVDASLVTFVIFWLTSGAYFIALGCARMPYKKVHLLSEAVEKGIETLRESAVAKMADQIEDSVSQVTLGKSLSVEDYEDAMQYQEDVVRCHDAEAYRHPALHCYLGCTKPMMEGCRGCTQGDIKSLKQALETGCGAFLPPSEADSSGVPQMQQIETSTVSSKADDGWFSNAKDEQCPSDQHSSHFREEKEGAAVEEVRVELTSVRAGEESWFRTAKDTTRGSSQAPPNKQLSPHTTDEELQLSCCTSREIESAAEVFRERAERRKATREARKPSSSPLVLVVI